MLAVSMVSIDKQIFWFYITGSLYKGHVDTLAPAVMELAKLERKVQTSFIDLKYKKKFSQR